MKFKFSVRISLTKLKFIGFILSIIFIMNSKPVNHSDSNERNVPATAVPAKKVSTKVVAKTMIVKVFYPGALGGAISSKLPKDAHMEIFRKTDPQCANLTDTALEMVFDSLSQREKKRLLINYSEKMALIRGESPFAPRKSKDEMLLIKETLPRVPYYHNDRPVSEAYGVRTIPAESVAQYIDPNHVPERVRKNDWEHWSTVQRLRYHLDLIADGNKFTWDYVEA